MDSIPSSVPDDDDDVELTPTNYNDNGPSSPSQYNLPFESQDNDSQLQGYPSNNSEEHFDIYIQNILSLPNGLIPSASQSNPI